MICSELGKGVTGEAGEYLFRAPYVWWRCVSAVVKGSVLSLGVLKYVVFLCKGCDGYCVFCLYCDAWSCRCLCMGTMSVSSCRCCMFVCILWQFSVLHSA